MRGDNDGQRRRWWNSGGDCSSVLRGDWHGDAWGRCNQAYIGVWEESGRIKI
jgi:hypothetical protein